MKGEITLECELGDLQYNLNNLYFYRKIIFIFFLKQIICSLKWYQMTKITKTKMLWLKINFK